MERKISIKKLTQVLVNIIFYMGIAITLSVPLWATVFYKYIELEHEFYNFMTFMLMFSGACAIFILYNLKCIFKTLEKDPFINENTRSLLNMGKVSFVIFTCYVIKMFFLPTLATVIIIVVFGMAGLFCLTMKDLFSAAIEYKKENDMTI